MSGSCFDSVRAQNAEICRDILRKAGFEQGDPEIAFNCGADSAQAFANRWLRIFDLLEAARERGDTELMLSLSEDLGRMHERMRQERGVDQDTQTRRGALTAIGKKQVKAGQAGNAMKAGKSFVARHGAAAKARAEELAANQRLSWSAIQEIVAREFGVSKETIKKSISNPKKVG